MIGENYPTYLDIENYPTHRTESFMWNIRNIFIMGEMDKSYHGDFKSLHDDWVKIYGEEPLDQSLLDEMVAEYNKYKAWENKHDLFDKLSAFKFVPYIDVNEPYDYNLAQEYLNDFLSAHIISCRVSKNIEAWMAEHLTYTQIYSTIVYKVNNIPAFTLVKNYYKGALDMRVIMPLSFKRFVSEIMAIRADDIVNDDLHKIDYKVADYLEAPDDEILLTKDTTEYVCIENEFVVFDKDKHGGMVIFKRIT